MPFVLGIDEAGYGPTLGPLTVGATLWRVDSRKTDNDFWSLLADSVCKAAGRGDWRLVVDDSKSVFDRKVGVASLERTVLSFAHAARAPLDSLRSLLEYFGTHALQEGPIPWYRELAQRLPLDPVRSKYEAIAERLSSAMHEAGVVCSALRCEVVTEDRFNQRVRAARNKSAVVVEQVLRHIDHAGRQAGDADLYVHVDRLGGRADYRGILAEAFPDRHLHVVSVTEEHSAYRLASARNDWHIDFSVNADQRHMCVALASMVAKYVREALMERFNTYWIALLPKLCPTAGYFVDAQRFLTDVRPVLASAGVAPELFVRAR